VIEKNLGDNSDYIAVFIPGGHGAIIGIPHSLDVKAANPKGSNPERLALARLANDKPLGS
jgi:hypothetical protein